MKVYHGTSSASWAYIKLAGLIPGKGQGGDAWAQTFDPDMAQAIGLSEMIDGTHEQRRNSIYVSDSISVAAMFAEYAAMVTKSKPVILETEIDDAYLLQDEQMFNAFRCICTVPPDKIREVS